MTLWEKVLLWYGSKIPGYMRCGPICVPDKIRFRAIYRTMMSRWENMNTVQPFEHAKENIKWDHFNSNHNGMRPMSKCLPPSYQMLCLAAWHLETNPVLELCSVVKYPKVVRCYA